VGDILPEAGGSKSRVRHAEGEVWGGTAEPSPAYGVQGPYPRNILDIILQIWALCMLLDFNLFTALVTLYVIPK